MAINLPNFLQAQTRGYGPEGLLESLMQGYQASRMPSQMRNAEAQQREMLEKALLGNQRERLEQEYLPQELEDRAAKEKALIEQLLLGNEAARTKNEFLAPGLEQERRLNDLKMEEAEFNALHRNEDYQSKKLDMELNRALIQGKINTQEAMMIKALAEAEKARNPELIQNEEQKAFSKAKGTSAAKFYDENLAGINKAQHFQSNINVLKDLTEDKSFKDVVGPIHGRIAKYRNNESAKLAGKIQPIIGQLLAEYQKQFAGAKSNQEMQIFQSFIPALKDTPAQFKGKIDTLERINKHTLDRAKAIAKYMDEGLSQHEATARAFEDIPVITSPEQIMKKDNAKTAGSFNGILNGKRIMNIHPLQKERFVRQGGIIE